MNEAPTTTSEARPRTLAEKVWEAHLVKKGEDGTPDLIYIDLHLVHEVTSPQAFDGLRMAGRPVRRPDLTIATEDHNTPTLAIDRPIADPTSRTQIETLRRNCEGVRRPPALPRRHRAGHRARRRPAAGTHAAGHHGRLRRLAHLDPRRVRRHGVRHRHERGRARARDADAAAQALQDHGDQRRGRPASRRDREGHHPRRHREDRHRRRSGLRARVPRQRDPGPLDGRPHDDLQHVDRGRRPSGHGGTGCHDLRLPEGPRPRPGRRRLGRRGRLLGDARHRRGRRVRRRGVHRRRHARAVRDLGHQPRPGRLAERGGARSGRHRRPARARRGRARARVHGPRRPARR